MFRLILISVFVSWANAAENRGGEAVELSYWCVHPQGRRAELSPVFLLHGVTSDRKSWDGVYEVIALQTNRTPERVEKLVVEDMRPNSFDPDARFKANVTIRALTGVLALIPEGATSEEAGDVVFRTLKDAIKQAFGVDMWEGAAVIFRDLVEFVDGTWRYKSDKIDILAKLLADPDFEDGSLEGRYEGEALFIYGQKSEMKVADAAEEIREQFPKALLVGIEGARHHVHKEKPRQFLSAVVAFINGC